jgi:hypothetical protein
MSDSDDLEKAYLRCRQQVIDPAARAQVAADAIADPALRAKVSNWRAVRLPGEGPLPASASPGVTQDVYLDPAEWRQAGDLKAAITAWRDALAAQNRAWDNLPRPLRGTVPRLV